MALWIRTQSYIAEISKTLMTDNIPFLVMIVPDFHNLSQRSPYKALYAKVEFKFSELGINTVNLFPIFQRRFGRNPSDLWIQADDPHPNERGHSVMADVLFKYLVRENPVELSRKVPLAHNSFD